MIAFVLSGGGNRGPLEVGALQALFAHDIQPGLLVGTSAGAMNAAFIATDPSLVGAMTLAQLWRSIRRQDVFPGNALTMAWRVLWGKDSLIPSDNVRRLVLDNLPPGVKTFRDLRVRLYTTAADLSTATLYLFGEDPDALIVDAVMASAALPVTFPPYAYEGLQLVDGGVVANVPIEIAMDKVASEIYAIDLGYTGEPQPPARGVLGVGERVLTTMIYQQLLDDLADASEEPGVTLHHIRISLPFEVSMFDFSHTDEMIEVGRATTEACLANPQPVVGRAAMLQATQAPRAPEIRGATRYVPRGRRV